MKPIYGVTVGLITEIDAALARVKVAFPWLDENVSKWARIAAPMSGKDRGVYYMPEPDDECVVAFEHGDFEHPLVIGFLWNGVDRPPASDRQLRLIRSVNHHEIAIYDPPPAGGDRGFIRIKDAHGNKIELANGRMTIQCVGALTIKAPSVTINGRVVSPVGSPI